MSENPLTAEIRRLTKRQWQIARFLSGIPAGLGGSVAAAMVEEFEANEVEIATLKVQRAIERASKATQPA